MRTKKTKAKSKFPAFPKPSSLDTPIDGSDQAKLQQAIQVVLQKTFGFKPTVRTLSYIMKRLDEFGYAENLEVLFQQIFTENRLQDFKTIFREVLNREAFENKNKRDIDVINAVNFALFEKIQGKRVAQEGLRSALRWRRERSRW